MPASIAFPTWAKDVVSLKVVLALLSLGECVVVVGNTPFHLWFVKSSSDWKLVLLGSSENCSPALIPVLGCFGDVGAGLVQGAAVGASSLGIRSGGDESASPHSPQKNPPFFFWLGLPSSNILKKTWPKMKWRKSEKNWEKWGFFFFLMLPSCSVSKGCCPHTCSEINAVNFPTLCQPN